MTRRPSLLSDDLLQQLIAVGQVDVVVGLPTLDNETTVGRVIAAVYEAFDRGFGRERSALVNSDGGSTDGTVAAVRAFSRGAAVETTHALRTIHRVVTPYHGLPGKRSALQTIFAAADLLQARVVAIVDPAASAPDPDVLVSMIRAVLDEGCTFACLAPARHPRDSPLVTQLLRPLLGAFYGTTFEDPLGEEYAIGPSLLRALLGRDTWSNEALRPGIDLWVHTQALATSFRAVDLKVPPRARSQHAHRPGLAAVVQQVVTALWTCLELDEERWRDAAAPPVSRAGQPVAPGEPSAWDLDALDAGFREGVRTLNPLLAKVLGKPSLSAIRAAAARTGLVSIDDELWVRLVEECSAAWRGRRLVSEHVASAVVPLYLGRAASFLRETQELDPDAVHRRVLGLETAFATARPSLVEAWLGRPAQR